MCVAELSNRYGANHPRIIAAESDLRAARENTKKAVDSVVSSITREYEVAKATEKTMQAELDKSKSEIRDMSRKEFQLAALERDAQSNRALYEMRSRDVAVHWRDESAQPGAINPRKPAR